jgi:hypothetical protein
MSGNGKKCEPRHSPLSGFAWDGKPKRSTGPPTPATSLPKPHPIYELGTRNPGNGCVISFSLLLPGFVIIPRLLFSHTKDGVAKAFKPRGRVANAVKNLPTLSGRVGYAFKKPPTFSGGVISLFKTLPTAEL